MSNEDEPCTWVEIEAKLLASGAQLMAVVMQAAQARAESDDRANVLQELLKRSDLQPGFAVTGSNMTCDSITLGLWLYSRDTGAPVARIFEITAQAGAVPCLH